MSDVDFSAEQLRFDALVYGRRADVNPYTVLMSEVQWRSGHVEWLRTQIQALPGGAEALFTQNRHGELVDSPLVRRYDKERDRLDRIVKVALDAGIAERYVRLAELHGEVMHRVLNAALTDPAAALTENQRVALVDAMKRALATNRSTPLAIDAEVVE